MAWSIGSSRRGGAPGREGGSPELDETAGQIIAAIPDGLHPHLVELATDHVLQPAYDFGDSFEFALDILLRGWRRR